MVLAPAWLQLGSYDRRNAAAIRAQRHADATQGAQLDRLIAAIKSKGGGRVYAGMPSNWGAEFTVGAVPVFKYLESRDVDEVGYTLRTASLMTDPEYYFDERDPGDYRLFAIHYLILPAGLADRRCPRSPELRAGPYALWTTRPRRIHPYRHDRRHPRRQPHQHRRAQHPGSAVPPRPTRPIPARRVRPRRGPVRPQPLPPAGGATPASK